MRALLIYPVFPPTFWSYEKILELVGRKVLFPPLSLITVAAILPEEWEFRLVDRNIRPVGEEDWAWADMVLISGMNVQRYDLLEQIREAKRRGLPVAVGGPYATSQPHEPAAAGADFLVLDEGEITIPMFLDALERGESGGTFRGAEKPDLTLTPVPRYELLELDAYDAMSIQFSRGCPFRCEFCDIIVLYGRKPRTKAPEQMLRELDYLYQLGWRRGLFMVDDNFIANRRNVKSLLRKLKVWQAEHRYPFRFNTEASLDLATDPQLMELMAECWFDAVFLGVETPDEESLKRAGKAQNTRTTPIDAVNRITAAGLRPMAGFIIGFDGEEQGAGERIVRFVEQAAIPTVMFSMLQALPHTALWQRLEEERRLQDSGAGDINQTTLPNFVPTRPLEEITGEYVEAFWRLYDPERYLDRAYRCFLRLAPPRCKAPFKLPDWRELGALVFLWRQGVRRSTRWKFWRYLAGIVRHNPGVLGHYLAVCAHNEHFLVYRSIVRDQVRQQLAQRKP